MKPVKTIVLLSSLVALLALIAAGAGLFWPGGAGPFTFTTLHGQTVEMSGRGLYRFDTLFTAAAFRGTDAVTLLAAIPLLVLALLLYRRGSLRGLFLLLGVLAFFLYNSASMALGAAYNNLFLVYIAYFAASFFAFVLALTSVDFKALPARVSPRLPHRGIAAFLFAAGLVTLLAWLSDILGALARGGVPVLLASYTTMITYVLDLGIIVPAAFLGGVLLLRRAPLGYPLAALMLILLTLVGLTVVAQTVAQLRTGISFSPGQMIGLIGSWVILALIAVWFTAALFRNIADKAAR